MTVSLTAGGPAAGVGTKAQVAADTEAVATHALGLADLRPAKKELEKQPVDSNVAAQAEAIPGKDSGVVAEARVPQGLTNVGTAAEPQVGLTAVTALTVTGNPGEKGVPTNSGKMGVWTAPHAPVGMAYGSRDVGVDTSPGAGAPPPTLAGYPMFVFPPDPTPMGTIVSQLPVPEPCSGFIGFNPAMQHQRIGSGWNTWSHGYTGDVYVPQGYAAITDLYMTMPENVCAIYFYVEPNTYTPAFAVTCIANEGLADEVSSGPIMVMGQSDAHYFGFYASGDSHVLTVHVNVEAAASGFAVGEFGIFCAPTCETPLVACCDEATATCVDQVDLLACIDQGGRYEIGVEFCADLDPACGALVAACCCGPAGEPGICEAYECIGDMTAAVCLAYGEETSWHSAETCSGPVPFDCNAPTYCDGSGGCDEYIAGVQLGDISTTSGCDGYHDYTDLFTYLLYGTDYTITVTNGLYYGTDITSVWIDWNQDKDFADAGELVASADPGGAIFTATFQVEAGALEGATRMRVRMQYGGAVDPCGTTVYGEVEDYTVIIGPPPPYGACCVDEECFWDDDPPMDEAACLLLGGVYQGDGTDCSPNPCVGACCDENTGDCTVTMEAYCPGLYLGDGTDCDPNECPQPPPECPPDSLYAALPYLPADPWTFGVSDVNFPYIRVENFFEVDGDVCDLHWWGGQLTASLGNCVRDPNTFEIRFFLDAGGQPGDQICDTYLVTPVRTNTGLVYHPTYLVQMFRFDVELLAPCCPVPPNAWISIIGVGDAACRFWWLSTPTGDASHCGGADFGTLVCGGANNFDFSMCLTGEYVPEWGACCWDEIDNCCDLNGDGTCDGEDYWIFAAAIPSCPASNPAADLDLDGCVTLQDYSYWLQCYQGLSVHACQDGVEKIVCYAADGRFAANTTCDELDPLCGVPGCCCQAPEEGLPKDPVVTDEANCDGRFLPGVTGAECVAEAFDPPAPCGMLQCDGLLYAPTEADNPAFRAEVSAITGMRCDYFDARTGTPTVDQMATYCCVLTWVNYAYASPIGMGDNLADYADGGGKAILGQWCEYSGQYNWLQGRIMTAGYCPVDATGVGSGSYNGDGTDCVHLVGPVTSYSSSYLDLCTLLPGAMSDGTMSSGTLAVAFQPIRNVYYSPGHTGGTYSTGDWAQLTANMCVCSSIIYGACCDGHTGICTDDVLVFDCQYPLQFHYDQDCVDVVPVCGNPGACCDIYTGDCADGVFALNCEEDRFEAGEQCAELEPECGTPGCCCVPPEEGVIKDPVEMLEANCTGRFLPGVTGAECVAEAFTPDPCGLWECSGMLYAPTQPDNPTFRAAVAAITGEPCDYFDARTGTPTVEQMTNYCCVMTWVNYAYADKVAMGNNLADYVDANGKAILGQWTYHTTQGNWLEGRIMTAAYCPVTATSVVYNGTYAGNGIDCVHVLGPVTAYSTQYRDVATAIAGAVSDGTFVEDAKPAVIWRADRAVYYSPGNTGASYGAGQWAQLTANMCVCGGVMIGACCDEPNGICYEDVDPSECTMPGARFLLDGACDDFNPPCGEIYGACCYDTECFYQRPSECTGEYQGNGIPCDPNPCLCADFFVDGPGSWNGDTTGAGDDCALRTGADQIWAVTIPYASTWAFSLCGSSTTWDTYMFVGTTCCGQEVGYNDDDCYYLEERSVLSEVRGVVGPGTYYVDIEPYSSSGTGPYTLHVFDVLGACCNDVTGSCTDGTLVDNCDPPLRFEGGTLCADLDPPCVPPLGACCESGVCVGTMLEADCTGDWFLGEDCDAGFTCPYGCTHTVVLTDSYGDGWTTYGTPAYHYLDVYVNGVLVLNDITLASGAGPLTVAFLANTSDTIFLDFIDNGSWEYECGYCVYDGVGTQLGCAVGPNDLTVAGYCPTCDHSVILTDSYGDGWTTYGTPAYHYLDVYVNGVLTLNDITLETGAGPLPFTFTAGTGDTIFLDFIDNGSYEYECGYCVYDGSGTQLGCTVGPNDLTVTGSCAAAVCGDGTCSGDEDCCNCPEDCGAYGCLNQPPNQSNGIFADLDCGLCGTGIQILADQFMVCPDDEIQLDAIRFWGGYYPDNIVTDPDLFTVIFRADNAGVPGDALLTLGPMAATTKAATGVVLFGVNEYVYTIDFEDLYIPAGTYFIELYNDTTGSTDQWFWEVGDLDGCAGVAGQAYTFTVPEAPWYYDALTDMSLELICVTKAKPPSGKPVPQDVGPTAPVSVSAQGVAGD